MKESLKKWIAQYKEKGISKREYIGRKALG